MSILVNIVGLALPPHRPSCDPDARIVAFAAGRILGTFEGRASNLRVVRLMRPGGKALIAAIRGWIVLDEQISTLRAVGERLVLLSPHRTVGSR